jgi:tetratricopeptide (TPR) repeat protein
MQRKPHVIFLVALVAAAVAAGAGCDKLRARDKLNKGVLAYRNGQFDVAVEDFKAAEQYDPSLTNAQLYLATAYASQYVPGAPSPENLNNGNQAVAEFKNILEGDPNNLAAIDGIGSILYNMGSTPYNEQMILESKSYHEKHIELKPDDPEPYYWVGVIDWALSYRANREMREQYNKTANAKKQIKESDPLPPALTTQFSEKYGDVVSDGITKLQKAISLQPDYDDAMAYLNLVYRQKADMESSAQARNDDLDAADKLVDQVKAIKQKKANMSPNS